MSQVVEIFLCGRQGPTYFSQYHGCWGPGDTRSQGISNHDIGFYPAALKGSGVLSYPERADGRAGERQGRQAPLTLSRP